MLFLTYAEDLVPVSIIFQTPQHIPTTVLTVVLCYFFPNQSLDFLRAKAFILSSNHVIS